MESLIFVGIIAVAFIVVYALRLRGRDKVLDKRIDVNVEIELLRSIDKSLKHIIRMSTPQEPVDDPWGDGR